MPPDTSVVTGASGFIGRYITGRLLGMGQPVSTLTGHPGRANPFEGRIGVHPFHFEHPPLLTESLRGVKTLYNTYWVRLPIRGASYDRAVENTRVLLEAASKVGIERVVHISVTGVRSGTSLPYFRGKAAVEQAIIDSGLSYAIVRPTLVYGLEDILLNNIAWFLRRFPVFPIAGDGSYRVQPIYVDDLAALAVRLGQEPFDTIVDAAGPETYTFEALLRLMAAAMQAGVRILHVPPFIALTLARLAGIVLRDAVLSTEELQGLMAGLLTSSGPAAGETRFSRWLEEHGDTLGRRYVSEMRRHYR